VRDGGCNSAADDATANGAGAGANPGTDSGTARVIGQTAAAAG